MALTDKLTAIADAIRGKTGGTEKLTLAEMPLAIAGIETGGGGGGNANTYSGDVVFDATTSILAAGITLNLGLPSRAKYFFMWMDRDEYLAIEKPTNNHYTAVLMLPVTVSTLPPIRATSSAVLPDTADRMFLVSSYHNATTASDSGYGMASVMSNLVTSNTSAWSANEDGTITISRFGSAATYVYAGTYHWIAVC